MNGGKVYEDGFCAVFQNQDEFLDCISRIGRNSSWDVRRSKSLRLAALQEGSDLVRELKEEYEKEGLDPEIITDTVLNTGLLLKVKGRYYPIRSCAIKSILDRAGISGNGLKRVEKQVYARILNDCLKTAKGEALIRISEGKISAVLGGDSHDYSILDMEQIFRHTVEYLKDNYRGCRYLAGFYEHEMASALWELSGNDELLDAYRKEISLAGKIPEQMKAVVRVTTSDTGVGGANIFPMLLAGKENRTISLGSPLRLGHRNGSSIREFDEQLRMLYGKYQLAAGNLIRLLKVEIQYPISCMKRVLDRLQVPKKYAAEAVEIFQAQNGEAPCTAHDIYYAMGEIPFFLSCDGEEGSRLARVEENISRALSLNWNEYDIAGDYKW
ncbi:MAG TPA: transposase [Candidatus Eisenbergiella merdavium]|uniref:Transposase n=1 Tax=Candidatus Eisenbergiella merdavium TaxID=2838551 RepID=A0A9D2NDR4_9FIRM|nr:transposase [Candidatus Eisenbergiella merdavium]